MMWSLYKEMLEEYPLPTEMATSAVLWFLGDILAQKLEGNNAKNNENHVGDITITTSSTTITTTTHKGSSSLSNNNLDWNRVFVQTIYAGFIWGIAGHYWYHWLDEQISKNNAKVVSFLSSSSSSDNNINEIIQSTIFVLSKLIMEMILLHPISLLVFFVCVGIMGGETTTQISIQLHQDFWPTLGMEYILWTPIDILNFAFVPVQHQLLVVNITCLFESIMLSFIKHNHGSTKTSSTKTTSTKEKTEERSIIPSFFSLFFNKHKNSNSKAQKKQKIEKEKEDESRKRKTTVTRTGIKEE